MTLADAQQQRLLERLREAGDEAVAFAELHASGIAFPAAVVSELELNGYVIERVYDHGRLIGVRLLQPEPPATPRLPAAAAAPIASRSTSSRSPRIARLKSGACSGRSTRRRRAGSASSFARCSQAAMVAPAAPRPWTGSSRLHAERTICAKLACSLHGRGSCRSPRNQYAHKPNDKVTASRRAAAGLRSAVPAPLPTSAPDRMHPDGCFPQCSGTNAPTPPMIVSPRFAKSVLVVRSRTTRWSCRC